MLIPYPFLGYLVLWLGSVILKSRRPKKGVGYEPLGNSWTNIGVSENWGYLKVPLKGEGSFKERALVGFGMYEN